MEEIGKELIQVTKTQGWEFRLERLSSAINICNENNTYQCISLWILKVLGIKIRLCVLRESHVQRTRINMASLFSITTLEARSWSTAFKIQFWSEMINNLDCYTHQTTNEM